MQMRMSRNTNPCPAAKAGKLPLRPRRARRAQKEQELAELEELAKMLKEDSARQRQEMENVLEGVVERFRSGRAEVLQDFVAIAPILERVGLPGLSAPVAPGTGAATDPNTDANAGAALSALRPPAAEAVPPMAGIRLPDSWAHDVSDGNPLGEVAFFERFCAHVHNNGFRFDLADLLAFHLSVKCNNFVVPGGVSGAGKSSLPRLYAGALAGAAGTDAARHLNVDVKRQLRSTPGFAPRFRGGLDR